MGQIKKLQIAAYADPAGVNQLLGTIAATINPSSYSLSYTAQYELSKEDGSSSPTQIFKGMGQSDFNLDLLVDGTGIIPIPDGMSVDRYIDRLKYLMFSYQGTVHRPNYLKISWGNLVYRGVCTSFTTNYKLFNADGTALRAEVKLVVAQSTDFKGKKQKAAKESPDLTHIRTVKAGDTLPMMAYRIYGDASYYMEVARVNGLNSIHAIRPGDELYFPPLKKV
ncbi:CIS tube protein [Chitinophaga pinensis]|uniref:LysM peptidoglycan-binding domain-containing protein n=1 Tax=Chitinophaga pinensis TaxID=79329 RepID=A0A5C6LN15_9BACT|nr:LysM peptidoglycan-binding domain-containing protein [Chitinophaga pinensis]TWV95164.1 LysM peptidoglycan-binding domain-containing protein [Chitinophaga pinensis]